MNTSSKLKHPLLSLLCLIFLNAANAQPGQDSSNWLNNGPGQFDPYQDQMIQGSNPMNPTTGPNTNNRGIDNNPVIDGGLPNDNVPVNNFPDPFAPGDPGPDPGIPVDGGLALLLAAGSFFGTRKIYQKFKKQ